MLFLFLFMRVEDIVEVFNEHIEAKRKEIGISTNGHLVLQRTIEPNSTFKVYKTYELILWFVKNKEKQQVLSLSQTIRVISGQEEKTNKDIDMLFTLGMINLIGSDKYEHIIKGEL